MWHFLSGLMFLFASREASDEAIRLLKSGVEAEAMQVLGACCQEAMHYATLAAEQGRSEMLAALVKDLQLEAAAAAQSEGMQSTRN